MKKVFKMKLPLYLQIVVGMCVGIVLGIVALRLEAEQFINYWIRPWGEVFIRLLQLIAVPLVFFSLIKGILNLKDIKRFSNIGIKTIGIYFLTTFFAVGLGLALSLIVKPGNLFNTDKAAVMQEQYLAVVAEKSAAASHVVNQGPLNFINDIIPNNFIAAAGDNKNMLQVIFFAVLFGISALSVGGNKIGSVVELFDSIYDIILKMVDYIILFAPLGVTALMAGLVVDFSGDISMFAALGVYVVTVILSMFVLMFVFYPVLIKLFTKINPKRFIQVMYPVQLLGFTTSSSAATLPFTLEVTEKELEVSNEVASFVLPVGTTINMDGTSCYQAIAVVFIAQVVGIDLSFMQLATIVGMTIISSIGTPAIPGGSYVILTMVLSSVGIPAEGLALILGVDRPLDMLRTAVNVTGDATVAAMVDNSLIKRC